MKIRDEQLAALQALAETAFETQVMEILFVNHAGAVAGWEPGTLRQRVRSALDRGRSHGFTWPSALAGFAVMMFEVGPNFDQHPAFARALAIRLPDQNARIRIVYDNLTEEDWEDARSFADARAWHRSSNYPC